MLTPQWHLIVLPNNLSSWQLTCLQQLALLSNFTQRIRPFTDIWHAHRSCRTGVFDSCQFEGFATHCAWKIGGTVGISISLLWRVMCAVFALCPLVLRSAAACPSLLFRPAFRGGVVRPRNQICAPFGDCWPVLGLGFSTDIADGPYFARPALRCLLPWTVCALQLRQRAAALVSDFDSSRVVSLSAIATLICATGVCICGHLVARHAHCAGSSLWRLLFGVLRSVSVSRTSALRNVLCDSHAPTVVAPSAASLIFGLWGNFLAL